MTNTTTTRERFDVMLNGVPVSHVNVPMLATSVVIESNGAKVEFVPADLPSHILNAALFKVISDKVLDAASGALMATIKAKLGDNAPPLSDDQKADFKTANAALITETAQIMLDKAVRALVEGSASFKGTPRDKAAADPLSALIDWLDDKAQRDLLKALIPTIGTIKKAPDRLPVIKAFLESDPAKRAKVEAMRDRAVAAAKALADEYAAMMNA
jgi:N-acetyl-beta-hexosaminidase